VSLVDVMATVADVVSLALPDNAAEDSVSLAPALFGEPYTAPLHDAVITHSSQGRFAIHSGRWKLAFCPGSGGWSAPQDAAARKQGSPEWQLYPLDTDASEQKNLVQDYPEVADELAARFRSIVTNGRSTSGVPQANDGPAWWKQLPWPKPE